MEWYNEDEKGRDFLRTYMMRKDRYDRKSKCLTPRDLDRPVSIMYRIERLTHNFHKGRISKEEYEKQRDIMHKYLMKRGRAHMDDHRAMMNEFLMGEPELPSKKKPGPWKQGLGRGPVYGWDLYQESSSSSEDEEERSEEKFSELEAVRRKWHEELDTSKWNVIYATKRMVSNQVVLQNDYNVDRITGMSKDLREPVFLTKMLYQAVRMRGAGVVKVLLKYGAWVNQPTGIDEKKYTPLHLACKTRQKDCVEVLIHSKAKVDRRDTEGNTCLLVAMHSGCNDETLLLLLHRCKSSFLTHVNANGENLLHCCGPFYEDEKKKEGLVDNTSAYERIINNAASKRELQQLLRMREKKDDCTPLHHAALANSEEKVQLLVGRGADPDVVTRTRGDTPVHIAATYLQAKSLRVLLEAGASVTGVNNYGFTPIACAFRNLRRAKFMDTIEVLLEYGGRVHDIVDPDTLDTVFHVAVRLYNQRLIHMMYQYGASPMITNADGRRLIDVFREWLVYDELYEQATRMRSLSEICKWKIRDSFQSSNIKKAVKQLPIPPHLQEYLTTKGWAKPRFTFLGTPGTGGDEAAESASEKMDYSEEPRPKPPSVARAPRRYYGDDDDLDM